MKKYTQILLVAFLAIFLTSCAHTIDVQSCIPPGTEVFGFWGGFWHGMIAGFSFIGSLFDKNISIWAINNNGGWYSFGFVLGVGGLGTVIKVIAAILD